MKKAPKIAILAMSLLFLSGCSKTSDDNDVTLGASSSETAATEETAAEEITPLDSDIQIAEWFSEDFTDSESFTDMTDYQYYARALGLDKDYFLNPEMWEVYYNDEIVNRNREIDNTDIYLIRLNPTKLLEIYAQNNDCTVEELCAEMGVNEAQLYYNWGYNPASESYFSNHKDKEVTYSAKEQEIFGIYNGESRNTVMSTHMITVDHDEDEVVYSSELSETMEVYREDNLNITTDGKLYSEFTDEEKSPAFKLNGIGIRAVIPLSIPCAYLNAAEAAMGDENVTVMINVSPFAYGCTDEDKLNLDEINSYIEELNT